MRLIKRLIMGLIMRLIRSLIRRLIGRLILRLIWRLIWRLIRRFSWCLIMGFFKGFNGVQIKKKTKIKHSLKLTINWFKN